MSGRFRHAAISYLLVVAGVAIILLMPGKPGEAPSTFAGPSSSLAATEIISSLNLPLAHGKSSIWCGSFVVAWKEWETANRASLNSENPIAKQLSVDPNPKSDIPPDCLHTTTGSQWDQSGIESDLKRKFSHLPTFALSQPPDGYAFAYAYLEAALKFPIPYDENRNGLAFTNSNGQLVTVRAFGIDHANREYRDKIYDQPSVLFRRGSARSNNFEFAIDLCSNSSPHQVVLAVLSKPGTLYEAVSNVDAAIKQMAIETSGLSWREAAALRKIGALDQFWAPEMSWAISHRFKELETQRTAQGKLIGKPLFCQQDIRFRMDRFGVRVESQADTAYSSAAEPAPFLFDRPFLIIARQRGATIPYFVMWVDNAELLTLLPSSR